MIFGLYNFEGNDTERKRVVNGDDEVVVRYYHPHSDLGEDAYHEWILLGSKAIKCDTNGKPHPTMYSAEWVAVTCNNWSCRAQATVHPARLTAALLEASGDRIFR